MFLLVAAYVVIPCTRTWCQCGIVRKSASDCSLSAKDIRCIHMTEVTKPQLQAKHKKGWMVSHATGLDERSRLGLSKGGLAEMPHLSPASAEMHIVLMIDVGRNSGHKICCGQACTMELEEGASGCRHCIQCCSVHVFQHANMDRLCHDSCKWTILALARSARTYVIIAQTMTTMSHPPPPPSLSPLCFRLVQLAHLAISRNTTKRFRTALALQ